MNYKACAKMMAVITLCTSSAYATMPVIDYTEIYKTVQLIKDVESQLDQLQKQYNELQNIKNFNSQQLDFFNKNLMGNFGYGDLFNGASDLSNRQWANDRWIDALSESSTGHGGAFSDAQKRYEDMYPVRNADSIGATDLGRTYYQQSSQISRTALAASSYSYDQINDHIKTLHDMTEQLEKEKSEKAAIDLNARLVAEIGFIELEILRQQTIQNQLVANKQQGEVNGISDQTTFMQIRPN